MDLNQLADRIRGLQPAAGSTVVVGIDGCGGAGKSTLARELAGMLPGSIVIHTDDFASWDEPLLWWPQLLAQVLVPLSEDRPAHYQRYDWEQRRFGEWLSVQSRIILLEGVGSTRREFRPFLAMSIWVDCPRNERLRRGLERDGGEMEPHWLRWMAEEDAYVAEQRPMEGADFVVSGTSM